MTATKGKQQNFQNRMEEIAYVLALHVPVHAWMPYISVCAKNSLSAGDAAPLWCLACGFLVKAVKQHSITPTDAQMCSARRDKRSMAYSCEQGVPHSWACRGIHKIKVISILALNNWGTPGCHHTWHTHYSWCPKCWLFPRGDGSISVSPSEEASVVR